jgi:hypothetical protein
MGLVRLNSTYNAQVDPRPDAEQITATVSFRIDTRFNEYISKADPAQRRLLRALRAEVLKDITWLRHHCAGIALPVNRHFDGSGGADIAGKDERA